MSHVLELTQKRKKKINKIKEKIRALYILLKELSDKRVFKLYATGKKAVASGQKGIPADEVLNKLF